MTKRSKYNIEELLAIDDYLQSHGHKKSCNIADTLQTSVYKNYQYLKENINNGLPSRLTSPMNTVPKKNKGNKIGRNHPCPCGSGKKYKKCCINK